MTATGKCVRAIIRGRVQGVGYRAWCAQAASARGLSGWVRNCRSGEVEALFSGEEKMVDTMLAAVWEGPRFARVLEVEVNSEATVPGEGFEIRGTV
ncbi:acylphosphatase [uncultured Roseibium sp.]|uniref:acylphosphatase n=1 Tax=uncultured Roseibium sp. TaxID=1936171 RepID=UPI0032169EFB